jgi:hypothetical protein
MDIRKQILEADDRKHEIVSCPEWACDVHVYSLTVGQLTRLEKTASDETSNDFIAQVVYLCACDSKGIRIFSKGDVEALQDKHPAPMARISKVAMQLSNSGGSPEALAEKNSETIPYGSPDIGLPLD